MVRRVGFGWNPWIQSSYLNMLSFMFGRALLRSAIFPTAQKLPTRAVLSNQCLALSARRNFMTTASNRDSESTTTLQPEPESKSKSKSTRKKTGSSTKASGKGKGRKATKRATKVKTKEKGIPHSVTFDSHTRTQCLRPPRASHH